MLNIYTDNVFLVQTDSCFEEQDKQIKNLKKLVEYKEKVASGNNQNKIEPLASQTMTIEEIRKLKSLLF